MIFQLQQHKQAYLALHIGEFSAHAIAAYNPGICTTPYVVLQQETGRQKSTIIATSPEAEKRDIVSGILLSDLTIRQRKGLKLIPRNIEYEQLVLEDLGVIAYRYTPNYEVDTSGGCVLDVSGTPLLKDHSLDDILTLLKEEVEHTTGVGRVGIGLSGMKTLSRMLARNHCPGSAYCPVGLEKEWLNRAEVFDLPELSEKCAQKMALLGIRRLEQIFPMSKREMTGRFGREFGEWLYMLSVGLDLPYRPFEKVAFQDEKVLFEDVNDDNLLKAHLLETADRVFHKIQRYGRLAKAMRVAIQYSDGRKADSSITLAPPTDKLEEADDWLYACFCKLYQRRVAIRSISVSCRQFIRRADGGQLSFFDGDDSRSQNRKAVINQVRERFGFSVLSKGTYHKVAADEAN